MRHPRHPSRRSIVVGLAAAVTVLASPGFAEPAQFEPGDPIFGVWELDVDRSEFRSRPAPRSQTRIYEPHPDGLKGTVITVDAGGAETTSEFVGQYDGVDHPYASRPGEADAIALERTGPLTASSTFSHAGIVVGGASRTISPDGREMTIRVEFNNNISSIEVYRKRD